MSDKKFRSSLFGGFNRDDVVKYIEKASEKTAEYRAESVKYHELVLANQKLQDKFNALQKEFGLDIRPEVPMVGMVGRLTEQKGFDLAIELMYRKLAEEDDIQWVLLGTGDPQLEKQLRELAEKYPNRVAAKLQYSNAMSHRIIAASDLFLMPSRFEPCGLTQMYSMRYGTIPVAHATGGLIDTITDMNDVNLENQTATGVQSSRMYAMSSGVDMKSMGTAIA